MLIDYLTGRAVAWAALIGKPHMIACIALLCALLVIDLAIRGWRLSWSRRAVMGVFTTLTIFHVNFLLVPLIWLLSEKVKALYVLVGIPSIPTTFWGSVPLWIMAVFALVAYDFANYWSHRLMHMRLLWPVHAIHHSDPDVNGLTAYRIHLFEGLTMWISYTLMLTWLGLPSDAIGIGAAILAFHNIYVHINVDWGHGPFWFLVASPRFHRWHHADVPEAYGKNLANFCPFYDLMFGTYYNPGTCKERMGAPDVPENDVIKLLLYPFKEWALMLHGGLSAVARRVSAQWSGRASGPDARHSTQADAATQLKSSQTA